MNTTTQPGYVPVKIALDGVPPKAGFSVVDRNTPFRSATLLKVSDGVTGLEYQVAGGGREPIDVGDVIQCEPANAGGLTLHWDVAMPGKFAWLHVEV